MMKKKRADSKSFQVTRITSTDPVAVRTVNRKRVKMIVSWMMISLLTLNLSSRFSICLTVIDVVTCSVNNNNTTVGHSPRKFSCLLWHFLSHRGEMECEVTGKEWHFLSFKVDWRFLAMQEIGSTSETH